MIELIIKDILLVNPKVERFKDTYLLHENDEIIDVNQNSSFYFYPGYKISFIETDRGNFLNVSLTHKFVRTDSLLNYFEKFGDINKREVKEIINAELKGRSFKVNYEKKNNKIDEILFNKNPSNQNINYNGNTINIIKYYEQKHNITIKNKDQPLVSVKKRIQDIFIFLQNCAI